MAAAQSLAQEIACYLGLELSPIKIKKFADGEIYVQVMVRTQKPCQTDL
jgi:phosphoribosylpyrophosphate synthetase